MVAYSFKPSFIVPIRLKEKRQTIRLPRKRHARPGEALQLFTGPRMQPERLGAALCDATREVRLDFKTDRVTIDDAIVIESDVELDAFAIRDGFNPARSTVDAVLRQHPWEYMSRWWAMTYPDQPIFPGVLVEWGESFEAAT